MLRSLLLPALLLISPLVTVAQPTSPPPRAIENVATFARLYGYVRYFHPSDEAAAVDWNRLAVYGCQRVEAAQTEAELRQALLSVFGPVAPTLQLVPAGRRVTFRAKTITPPNAKSYQVISWQHRGLGQGIPNNVYRSIRLNRPAPLPGTSGQPGTGGAPTQAQPGVTEQPVAQPLFAQRTAVGEAVQEDLGSGLRCVLPLALYGTRQATWPVADSAALRALQTQLAALTPQQLSSASRALRLADVVISWNIFQHFYPYFARIPTNWPATLPDALRAAYPAQSEAEYLQTLRRFTAELHDGHVRVTQPRSSYFGLFRLPISWEWVQDQLVVTQVWDDSLALRPGDVVMGINGQPAAAYLHAAEAYVSAATPGWLRYRTATEALLGPLGQRLRLQVQDAQGTLRTRSLSFAVAPGAPKPAGLAPARLLAPAVYYLNLDQLPMDSITRLLPRLAQARAIVCDLRGYPKSNHDLLRHLLVRPDTAGHWMRVPHLIYPNQQRVAGYYYEGWQMTPAEPHLAARIIFLTDSRAISYCESVLGMVQGCGLGTIVGQPTAGTNGNINPFLLPGPYDVSWTGMEVRRHDGTPHHGVGVRPNVYAEKTIRGVREGRDELLEKALELATAP